MHFLDTHLLKIIVIGLSTKMLDQYCVSHSNLCALYCQGTSIETDICVQTALDWVIYPLTQPQVANQQKIQTALHCGGLNTKHVSIFNGPKLLVGEWFCFWMVGIFLVAILYFYALDLFSNGQFYYIAVALVLTIPIMIFKLSGSWMGLAFECLVFEPPL